MKLIKESNTLGIRWSTWADNKITCVSCHAEYEIEYGDTFKTASMSALIYYTMYCCECHGIMCFETCPVFVGKKDMSK